MNSEVIRAIKDLGNTSNMNPYGDAEFIGKLTSGKYHRQFSGGLVTGMEFTHLWFSHNTTEADKVRIQQAIIVKMLPKERKSIATVRVADILYFYQLNGMGHYIPFKYSDLVEMTARIEAGSDMTIKRLNPVTLKEI